MSEIVDRLLEEDANWMQDVHPKKGALHRALGIPEDEKIPDETLRAAAKKGGHLGKMANLALRYRGESKLHEGIDIKDVTSQELARIDEYLKDVKNEIFHIANRKIDVSKEQMTGALQCLIDAAEELEAALRYLSKIK